MRDLIDERNYKEKFSKSIIKGYNVHYMTKEELAEESAKKLIEQMKREEEEKRRKVIENISVTKPHTEYTHQQDKFEEDTLTREQIEKILGEREARIQKEIENC